MSTELVVHRVLGKTSTGLIPVSDVDVEALQGVPMDKDIACKLWMPRSLPMQRFYRGLVSYVAAAVGMTHDQLHVKLKMRYGLFDRFEVDRDRHVLILRTTSFTGAGALDDIEFKKYLSFSIDVILQEILPGVPRGELVRKIEQMVGVAYDFR